MTQEQAERRSLLYVRGEWRDGADELVVTDLADGHTFATVEAADADQARAALAAADAAEPAMRDATVPERVAWLEAIADGLREREAELAETIVREAGKPISSARGEVDSAAERFERAVEELRTLHGEYRRGTTGGHEGWEAIVRPEPVGTVLAIAPYNYPLATTALQVAPALAAGNAVVCKPASHTPVSGGLLAEVIDDVGLPDGAFNFVPGRGSEIGDVLSGDERVDAVALTGSTAAGERVADESGVVELHMELGGNAPAVVLPDADIEAVAGACAAGSMKYGGQRCSAVSRVLAHESVHDEVVERLEAQLEGWEPGDLFEESTAMGPLISESQAAWVQELVDDAVERGAELRRGGSHDGPRYEPTLLADVPRDARILDEEQFGPVAVVTRVEDADDAVELANRSDLALDACVFTSDYDAAMDLADRLDAGAVRINGRPSHGIGDLPYGGNGDSGIGREGLGVTIETFTTTKTIIL